MSVYVSVTAVILNEIQVVLLTLVHAAHGSAVHKTALLKVLTAQFSLTQSLMQGYHSHQCRTGCGSTGSNTHDTLHLLIGQFYLTNGELRMLSLEILERPHAGTHLQERIKHLSAIPAYGTYNAAAGYQH